MSFGQESEHRGTIMQRIPHTPLVRAYHLERIPHIRAARADELEAAESPATGEAGL